MIKVEGETYGREDVCTRKYHHACAYNKMENEVSTLLYENKFKLFALLHLILKKIMES